ncbi:acetyl-CoA carboxylase biotin carboxyl carrier protein [Catenulispora rubra]|uniref:acetyl-CoA carboxylase biotin carboxyl carrier protein n=1 Tax=Catenulispora rubra TaxID=280293 RepID=UPI002B277BB9|nr:biotin/lipoyl-containing protein [Catenulispora rubra]
MTTDLRDEAAKNGVVRRHATGGVMRAAAVGPETADLAAMCHHVADLARTRPEPPSRIRLEHLGTALEIEWPAPVSETSAPVSGAGVGRDAAGSSSPHTDSLAAEAAGAADDGFQRVCAPMIGTFYHSPEPGAPPFVAVGDSVVPGQRIGILEVMKMMSPVEVQVAGIVREVLVPDGGAVEFQQPLIVVEPAREPSAGR